MAGHRKLSIRMRWLLLRSRLSLPTLLSELDEDRIVSAVTAINGGAAILVIALTAWLSGLPLLFPSLGPTAFLMFVRPFSDAACPRSVVLGHTIGIACGWSTWALVSAIAGVSVSIGEAGLPLCASAALCFMITGLLLVRLSCPHAPAAATALIVATGATTQWHHLLVMEGAVILVALQGVVFYRLAGVHAPLWRVDPRHEAALTAR